MTSRIKDMSDRELDLVVDNEKEWRTYILKELRDMRKEQSAMSAIVTGLRVKVALFGSVFGFITGVFGSVLTKYFLNQ
jgi:hypothetical protein